MNSGQTLPPQRGSDSKAPTRRRQYSREFKLAVIDECHTRTNPELPPHERLSKYKIAHNFQITEKMLAEWLRNEDAIRLMQAGRKKITSVQYRAAKSRSVKGHQVENPVPSASYEQEAFLYSSGSSHPHTPLHDINYAGEVSSSARPSFHSYTEEEGQTSYVGSVDHMNHSSYVADECAQQGETDATEEYDDTLPQQHQQQHSYDPLYMYQSHIPTPLVGTPYDGTVPINMHEDESYWSVYPSPSDDQAWENTQNPMPRSPWNGDSQ